LEKKLSLIKKIPTGYKQTELGVIPEDWEVKNLGQVAKFSQGVQVDLNKQIKEEQSGYIKFLRIENYTQLSDDFRYIPIEYGNNKIVGEDEIVVVRYGATAGFVGTGFKGVLANNLFKVEPNPKYLSKEYLHRYMKGETTYSYFQNSMFGGAMPALSFKVVKSFIIPIPTKPEQTAIATVLSDTDALIEHLERLIAKKKDLKQGAGQQLLTGKKRLPGFNGEWKVKKLGEIGEITGAGIDKKSKSDEIPVRLVNYLDVFHKNFIYSKDLNHWVTAPLKQSQRCAVKKGDIFFTPSSEMRYDIGISAVAMEDIPDAGYSYHLDRLRLFEDWDLAFRTYIFKTKYFLDQAETICEGSGKRYVISLTKFREMTVRYPIDKSEQIAIANILSDMDAEIEKLEQKRDKYIMLKQGMMQQLLTGRIRIYDNN